jgi:ABC-type nitrate/sulfonate/bicarbonate transport system substrate-binding protein
MKVKMSKKLAIVLALIIILSVISAVLIYQYNWATKEPEAITIAEIPTTSLGLLYIAQNQSYYSQNSLNVTFQSYPFAAPALNDLISGRIDVAISTEYPFVGQVFNNASIKVISTFAKAENVYVISRPEADIQNASDLAGKRIGLAAGSINQFQIERFLSLKNIDKSSVNIVNVAGPQQLEALDNGTIDGLVGDLTTLARAQQNIGSNLSTLAIQEGQPSFLNLVCRSDWISTHTETIKNLLNALNQAEQYYQNNPSKAQIIILSTLNLTDINPKVWSNTQFSLSLEQSLVVVMKDEAQWMINNHLTNQTQVPNMIDYIYTDGLKAVKPDAVTVIK